MEYACAKCDCTFSCEIEIRFCPFCGTAYERAADEQSCASRVRIAIDSDSERVVQEKYWRKSRAALHHTLRLLELLLPDEAGTCSAQLQLDIWLNQQRKCRSSAQFKKQFGSFLDKIHTALQDHTLKELPEPIDVLPLAEHIKQTCTVLLQTLGEKFLPEAMPQMVYEPILSKAEEEVTDAAFIEPYRQLLSTIESTRPVFESILDENGVFVAVGALEKVLEGEETAEPLPLVKQLSKLAQKDYDPLFGEEYDDFILTFWKSVLCAADAANCVMVLPERDENEQNKMRALQDYLSDWEEALDIALDRLYASQTKSMIEVCKELEEIEKNCSRRADGVPIV